MPYIGASNTSHHSFASLKQKHSIGQDKLMTKDNNSYISDSINNSDCDESLSGTESDLNSKKSNVLSTVDGSPLPSQLDPLHIKNASVTLAMSTTRDMGLPVQAPLHSKSHETLSNTCDSQEIDMRELYKIPNESTHAYAYNPSSPNSLAVRLSILKRSLEIIIGNPAMLRDPTEDTVGMPFLTNHPENRVISDVTDINRRNSTNTLRHARSSIQFQDRLLPRNHSQRWNTNSAALNAVVNNSISRGINNDASTICDRHNSISGASRVRKTNSLAFLPTSWSNEGSPVPNSQDSPLLNDYGLSINSPRSSKNKPSMFKKSFTKKSINGQIPLSPVLDENLISRSSSNTLSPLEDDSALPSATNDLDKKLQRMQLEGNAAKSMVQEQRSNLISLLDILNDTLEKNTSDKAPVLHMMSLHNLNNLSLPSDMEKFDSEDARTIIKKRTIHLKKTLLDSLAEPFFEHSNSINPMLLDDESELERELEFEKETEYITGSDNSIVSELRPKQDYGSLLRTFSSTKNSTPQAIFTCYQSNPFHFKSANDLACLIFGVSQSDIKALTLLDLIHPDSRNFVIHKIISSDGLQQVFSGEIIGIIQPGAKDSSGLVWATIWAKRKNGLLVCVFERVPCDYIDILLDNRTFLIKSIHDKSHLIDGLNDSELDDQDFEKETSHKTTDTKTKRVQFTKEQKSLKDVSLSLDCLIEDVRSGKVLEDDDDLMPMDMRVSRHINKTRYFTIKHSSYNIPCAISATVLDNTLKIQIHSTPYEAGLFVINMADMTLLSFNRSICKNMFGYHFSELVGQPVTRIIPSFKEIVKYIDTTYPALSITDPKNKGLVLTEHYFRKMQAEMDQDPELFYTSVGIGAKHRDGCNLDVDIQLRVIDSNTVLIWLTYSRDIAFPDYNKNPSQLKMLKESDISVLSSSSSSSSLSRSSFTTKKSSDNIETLPKPAKKSWVNKNVTKDIILVNDKEHTFNLGENEEEESEVEDPELKQKLALAKLYNKDKSRFINDGNFKVNEELIRSKISLNESSESLDIPPNAVPKERLNSTSPTTFLQYPAEDIGSRKHTIKFSDYLVLQKMGEGAYGKVSLCMHKRYKYVVVIKMIFKERILVDTWVRDRKLGTIPSEIQIMATLNKHPHQNILQLLDFFEDDSYYYIETPVHGESGCIDLFDLIEFKPAITELEIKLIFKQVAAGIKHLHDHGIVHRDIKDENMIVDANGFVKLIDFGSAAYVKSGPFDVFVGTIDYAAPEVLGGNPYEGKPQDIWAIGILLYTLVFKENPFYNIDEIMESELRLNAMHNVDNRCLELIQKILNRNVMKRPTIDDIYQDDWLALQPTN